MNSVDANLVLSNTAVQLIKDMVKATFTGVTGPIRKNIGKITTSFEEYLTECYRHNKYVRILSDKSKPIELETVYSETIFKCANKTFVDQDIVDFARDGKKMIVKGDGGLGKTFFTKKLWCSIFENRAGKVPIYIKLRDLNDLTEIDIEAFIRGNLFSTETNSLELFKYFCSTGDFIFIFDGFDEVIESKREKLVKNLMSLTTAYPKCGMIISTRDTGTFNPWGSFSEYTIEKLNRDRIITLLQNVPYDNGIKEKFLKKITKQFFLQNESFLSNPLLAIMMMMTFHNNPDFLPKKKSIFYENAFLTLYSLHDGMKDAYQRHRALDKDEFRRLFSVFCLITYQDTQISFSDEEIRRYIEKSISSLNMSISVDETISEFHEKMNLIQFEGLEYSFIHRSFQEYFAAYCVTRVLTKNHFKRLSTFYDRPYDQAFLLAFEIHPLLVAEEFLLPKYKQLKDKGFFPKNKRKTPNDRYYLSVSEIDITCMFILNSKRENKSASNNLIDSISINVTSEPIAIFSHYVCLITNTRDDFFKLDEDLGKWEKIIEKKMIALKKDLQSSKYIKEFTTSISKGFAKRTHYLSTFQIGIEDNKIIFKHIDPQGFTDKVKKDVLLLIEENTEFLEAHFREVHNFIIRNFAPINQLVESSHVLIGDDISDDL